MTEVAMIPLDKITVEEQFNPRLDFGKEPMDELIASVKQHGVLQAVRVKDGPTKGTFVLVDGERRYRAALAAKLAVIPAVIRNGEASLPLVEAVVANLVREDLNPVEQAHAFRRLRDDAKVPVKQIAKQVSRSVEYVEGRLAITTLPEQAQQLIASGEIPLAAVPNLAVFQSKQGGDQIVLALAEAVSAVNEQGAPLVPGSEIAHRPDRVLDWLCEQAQPEAAECPSCEGSGWNTDDGEEEGDTACPVCNGSGEAQFPDESSPPSYFLTRITGQPADSMLTPEQAAWITEQVQPALDAGLSGSWNFPKPRLGKDDAGAAVQYGAAITVGDWKDAYNPAVWVVDRDWWWAQIEASFPAQVKAAIKEQKARVKREEKWKQNDATKTAESKAATVTPEQREQARQRNIAYGRAASKKLAEVPADADTIRAVLALIFGDNSNRGMGATLALIDETLQEEQRNAKTGALKTVKYMQPNKALAVLWQRIEQAQTPEQVLGVFFQAVLADHVQDSYGATRPGLDRDGILASAWLNARWSPGAKPIRDGNEWDAKAKTLADPSKTFDRVMAKLVKKVGKTPVEQRDDYKPKGG